VVVSRDPAGLHNTQADPNRYECIDFATELESCGGCASTGEGVDCTAIPNALSVGCEKGVCAGKPLLLRNLSPTGHLTKRLMSRSLLVQAGILGQRDYLRRLKLSPKISTSLKSIYHHLPQVAVPSFPCHPLVTTPYPSPCQLSFPPSNQIRICLKDIPSIFHMFAARRKRNQTK
jgi:hypothetical protein